MNWGNKKVCCGEKKCGGELEERCHLWASIVIL